MSIRLLLCLLLICASFPLMARDIRMMGANGNNGGDAQDNAQVCDDDASQRTAAKPSAHVVKPAKAKPSVSYGDSLGDVRPPRWHSFLPGMFR